MIQKLLASLSIIFILLMPARVLAIDMFDLVETRTGATETTSRSNAVLAAFKRIHPCPSTNLSTGPCPGWNIDHVIPRACGGRDAVSNLQWLPVTIKRTSDPDNKDRWERKIYCYPRIGPIQLK